MICIDNIQIFYPQGMSGFFQPYYEGYQTLQEGLLAHIYIQKWPALEEPILDQQGSYMDEQQSFMWHYA